MQDKVKGLEKKYSVDWREYEIGELFEIRNTLSFNKDKLILGNEYDYVTRTSQNQGILQETGFVNHENLNPPGIWSLGLLQMDFFYRKKPWYAGQFVRKIIPRVDLSKNAVLYFTVLLNRQKKNLLSGLVRDVDKTFLTSAISLPIINNKIAFNYIEEFISTLEAERLATLEAYLLATGLNDYELTEAEREATSSLESIEWAEFELNSLFDKSTRGKRLKAQDRSLGELPFVTAGETNMGISGFIDNKVQVFSKNTITIDMFGSAKYRNYSYGADDHVAVVHTENLDKYSALFTTTSINKSSHAGQFDYSRNFYATDADVLIISLPITADGKIDYNFMNTLIKAIQKGVIRGVVEYIDKRIVSTNKVINDTQK